MGNAKVTIAQQDRSSIVPTLTGVETATVINADWGPIVPTLNTSPDTLLSLYNPPNNKKGSSWNGAEILLASTNKLWLNRAIHEDALYSAALVKFKIDAPDYNDFPAPTDVIDTIVTPLPGGIALNGIDSYTFPLYSCDRIYVDMNVLVQNDYTAATQIEVASFTGNGVTLDEGSVISFGPFATMNDTVNIYTVEAATVELVTDQTVTLDSNLTAVIGTEVKKLVGGSYVSYTDPLGNTAPVYLAHAVTTSETLVVTNNDLIINGDTISLDGGITTAHITNKAAVTRNANILTLGTPVTVANGTDVQYMSQGTTEFRDSFLGVAIYPGANGQNIALGTRPSVNYPGKAFFIDIYYNQVLMESWEVTKTHFLDGFGNQMYLTEKVNGQSKFLFLVDNVADTNETLPLFTTYGVWQQSPTTIFGATAVTTSETVVTGNVWVDVSSTTIFSLNDRIKFGSATAPEYKVLQIANGQVQLDRPLVESSVAQGATVYRFDSTVNTPATGIYAGIQYYKYTQIAPLSNYDIGDTYIISGVSGTLIDCGINSLAGGSDGSPITVADVITAFQAMSNPEQYKISLFCENGFSYPEVAQALDTIVQGRITSHSYVSSDYASETADDFEAEIINYRNSLNLDTAYSSMFCGWVQITDVHNQTKVWVAPTVFGVSAQSFVTRNYTMYTPAAGWVFGRLNGLQVTQHFDDGTRDALVDAQINPIRYRDGYGLAIWGNETLYVKPSPLQLRSIAMLLIVLKYGLQDFLEFELFDMDDPATWVATQTAIDTFIRDNLADGLYDWTVQVSKIITSSDIDNRNMPVFVGIQPTEDIKTIPVTIGIFNKSVQISY